MRRFGWNTNVPLDEEAAKKQYEFASKSLLYFWCQNSMTAPLAKAYVDQLFTEAPDAQAVVQDKLAVVTGVTVGGVGYYLVEELALNAGMAVVMMGRNPSNLEETERAIQEEAKKHDLPMPKLYHVHYDLDDLNSAVTAAEDTIKIANEHHDGKLHILINNAGVNVPGYKLTKQGVEANAGRNFLTPLCLSERLMSVLKAAATDTYKPRCVFVSSLGYSMTLDLDPDLLLKKPEGGGSPEGFLKFDKNGKCTNGMVETSTLYGRAKLANVAAAHHLATREPSISFTSLSPGSIVSNFGKEMGLMGAIYYYGFYPFQFSASQGARAALRAALDPDFNSVETLQGAYLHCDGNPWPKADLKINDPDSKKPYEWDTYSKKVVELGNQLIDKLLKQTEDV